MATSLVTQPTAAPTRKVLFTAVAGAGVTIAVWIAKDFYGVEVPGEVQGTIHTALAAVVGYLVKDRMNV